MNHHDQNAIRQSLSEWSTDLALLWQNNLLNESSLISFAKDRGLPVFGVVSGDPGNFYKRGWLTADGLDSGGKPLFHPFRFFVLHRILELCKLRIAPSASLNRDIVLDLVERSVSRINVEEIGQLALNRTEIVDFAVLLEPVYWPEITGWLSRRLFSNKGYISEIDFNSRLEYYREKVKTLVSTLDPKYWQEHHKLLRKDAALLDGNNQLYILLRLSDWKQRDRLKGELSAALWIRHLAEVIRRAFEEVHRQQWPEEDEAFGTWVVGGRKLVFGFDRPLDNLPEARSYLAKNYGLHTGSAVRWYVEGPTEYYAVSEVIPDPQKFGIEIVNLWGNVAADRQNAVLRLGEWLREDQAQRRFSIISFDTDEANNVKAIRRQVQERRIVGFIGAHTPDFEFANFAVEELVEVAARLDEEHGVSGDAVREVDWNDVSNMRDFEIRYRGASLWSPPSLKGERWGRALASYAVDHPSRSDNGVERSFWEELEKAIRCRSANYDVELENWEFDPVTFRPIPRSPATPHQ